MPDVDDDNTSVITTGIITTTLCRREKHVNPREGLARKTSVKTSNLSVYIQHNQHTWSVSSRVAFSYTHTYIYIIIFNNIIKRIIITVQSIELLDLRSVLTFVTLANGRVPRRWSQYNNNMSLRLGGLRRGYNFTSARISSDLFVQVSSKCFHNIRTQYRKNAQ